MLDGFLRSTIPMLLMAFAIVFVVKVGLPWLFNYLRKQRLITSDIADIDQMDGKAFEQYLEALFERKGYKVERTRYVGDYGADLVIRKDGVKTILQAKRWKKTVGVKAIQEAVAAKAMYGCTEAMVVTNSTYSKQAVELAKANKVVLWDRERLIDALLSVTKDGQPLIGATPSAPPTAGGSPAQVCDTAFAPMASPSDRAVPPACVLCRKPVSAEVVRYCLSRSQRFGGHIYCYDHQRTVPAKE